jgi:hypothetical protein
MTLRVRFLQLGLVFWDSVAPLPEDAGWRTTNRLAAEQEKQKKDTEKTKKAERLRKRDRGEDTDNDDDDDDDEDDKEEEGSAASHPLTGMRWHVMTRMRPRVAIHLRN